MSKRNSQEAKRVARERLRAEREKEAKKAKMRRQLGVAGAVVAALAVMGGIGFAVTKMLEDEYWDAAAKQDLVAPANTSGKDGLTVLLGDKDAPKTLELYEDPRCPGCAGFEQNAGAELKKGMDEGKYNVEFYGANFLDRNIGGEGSKNAMSALGAALNVSPDAFMAFKAAMYSDEFHPDEGGDPFAKDDYLIKIGDSVPELKGNKQFAKDVREGTFDRWGLEQAKIFDERNIGTTPTLRYDGKPIIDESTQSIPSNPEALKTAIDKAIKD
ncbi:thioredoxin domain-containing protein [Streptomyces durbertensis]|uniref:Thioredoxin domain-containing protein n=1 Tax=Streptomyces durbertensis TaxID=2448886 RepID=A0ABR6EGH4_9ACTN|nr:thioredoxin domain-containing protein [Streptomyces durbertensis]MBB1244434.1 thioredoxin domain-containing protein [Streptomyces durbertensis]